MSTAKLPAWVADCLRDCPPIVTIQEAAELTRLSARTIRRAHAAGRLVALKSTVGPGSARLMFPRAELARLLVGMAS